MNTYGFISKRHPFDDFDWMNDLFADSDKYVYFIEDEITHMWLTENHTWTNDPSLAISFKSNPKAKIYAIENKLSGWIITEHEFIK